MTKKSIVTLALLGILTLASSAHAAGPTSKSRAAPPASSGSSYVSEPYSGGGSTFSLGFTTGTAGGVLGAPAVTALVGLRNGDKIDIRLAVPNTTGSFAFGIGGLYKHVISTHGSAGFHMGGGAALGTVTGVTGGVFGMTLAAIGGIHFQLPSLSAISVHFDGGPAFTLLSTEPSSTTNFSIQAFSALLGMSIYYTF